MWSCLLVKPGGRCDTPERVGINIDDARIPDNKGNPCGPFKKMAPALPNHLLNDDGSDCVPQAYRIKEVTNMYH